MKTQVDVLKFLNFSNKINELKQIESIFPKNTLNYLIFDQIKNTMQLQNNIKLGNLEYSAKRGKCYNFIKYSLPIVFLKDIHERNLSLNMLMKQKVS